MWETVTSLTRSRIFSSSEVTMASHMVQIMQSGIYSCSPHESQARGSITGSALKRGSRSIEHRPQDCRSGTSKEGISSIIHTGTK